jgi:hypothetical protein
MNFKTATLRQMLALRRTTVERLARSVKVNPRHLLHVLNEQRKGRYTWQRIENGLDSKERALIVELYGPVFGEEADATLGTSHLMQDDDFAIPDVRVEDEEPLPIFESQGASTQEIEAAHALISWVDRACGHSARLTGDFTQPLIEAAVEVTRNFQGPEIEEAMNYLIKGRDNPAVVKRTDFVLTHFAEYVRGT